MLDNRSSRDGEPVLGFLTMERSGRPEHTPDVIGVVTERDGDAVRLDLGDDDVLVCSYAELLAALKEQRGHMKEAA